MYQQLLSRGISGTSYASIAEFCNTSRAVVQDYYPKKDDMVKAFVQWTNETVMEATLPFCDRLGASNDLALRVGHLYLAGSTYFEFMQREEGRKALFAELLRNRDYTEMIIFAVMDRSFAEIGREDVAEDPAYRNDLIMSIGGFFELFYYHLMQDRHFYPALYYGQMTRIWMLDAGFGRDEIATALNRYEDALEDIDAMVAATERLIANQLQE